MNPLLFAGSIVVGYLGASFIFPQRGWASKKPTDKQHIEKGGIQDQDKKIGHEPFSPQARGDRLQLLHQGNKPSNCPGGIWTEADGVIYCKQQWADAKHQTTTSHFPSGPRENITSLGPATHISDTAPDRPGAHRLSIA